jgi:hypothetical protein
MGGLYCIFDKRYCMNLDFLNHCYSEGLVLYLNPSLRKNLLPRLKHSCLYIAFFLYQLLEVIYEKKVIHNIRYFGILQDSKARSISSCCQNRDTRE